MLLKSKSVAAIAPCSTDGVNYTKTSPITDYPPTCHFYAKKCPAAKRQSIKSRDQVLNNLKKVSPFFAFTSTTVL